MTRILVDTNILLDHIQKRSPHDAPASKLWGEAEAGAIEAYVAAISFNNLFYIARKQVGHDRAIEAVREVKKVFKFAAFDSSVLEVALALKVSDLEDAIQAASAAAIQADFIVTRNAPDFRSSPVKAITAAEFLTQILP